MLTAPVVRSSSAVIAPAMTVVQTTLPVESTTLVQAPMIQQTLVQSAIMMPASGFAMDPAALRLYTGPRFENTLTMPSLTVYLRP